MAVRLDILPGEGTICRRGGVAAWVANDIAPELRDRLLALLSSSDGPEGRAMLRRVAGLVVDAPDAESGIGFGVLAQETDTLAVLLHGRVSVAAERGARLNGAESPTWIDAEIPLDGVVVVGPGTPEDLVPSSPFTVPTRDLSDGSASGGGLVVHVLPDEPEPAAGAAEAGGAAAGAAAAAAVLGAAEAEGMPTAPEAPLAEPSESTPAVPAGSGGAVSDESVAPGVDTSADVGSSTGIDTSADVGSSAGVDTSADVGPSTGIDTSADVGPVDVLGPYDDLGPSDEPPFEPPSPEPLASEAGLPYEHVPTHAPPAYESPIAEEPISEPAAKGVVEVVGDEPITEPAPEPAMDVAGEAAIASSAPIESLAPEAPFDQASEAAPFDQAAEAATVQGPPDTGSEPADEGWLEAADTAGTPAAPPPAPPAPGTYENGATPVPGAAMVSAVVCELGHVNDPRLWECMVCGRAIPPQQPVVVAQPSLGVLVLDDGSIYELDRGYVVGRAPEVAEAVQTGYVGALTVSDPEHLISRAHAEIRLEDWDVVVADLGSANGTFLWNVGDADWARLIPHQGVVLRPGGQIAFGRRSISFERALPQ